MISSIAAGLPPAAAFAVGVAVVCLNLLVVFGARRYIREHHDTTPSPRDLEERWMDNPP